MSAPVLILSDEQVKQCITIPDAITIQRYAFRAEYYSHTITPDRISIQASLPRCAPRENGTGDSDVTLFKPSFAGESLGLKIAAVRDLNSSRTPPLSTVQATIVLHNVQTGQVQCLMNATYLTALRTAAGSAVATDLFAAPDAKKLIVIGAGLQARLHIQSILHVRPTVTSVCIINRTPANADKLAADLRLQYSNVQFSTGEWSNWLKLPGDVDIICTTTSAGFIPVLTEKMLQLHNHHLHINAIGSFTRDKKELDEYFVGNATVVIDTDSAKKSGDIAQCKEVRVDGVLGKYIQLDPANQVECGLTPQMLTDCYRHKSETLHRPDSNLSIFKSVGTAVQDITTAYAVYHNAKQRNVGTTVDM